MDPALEPFLNATDEADEEVLLAAMLESARPILRRVAGAKLGGMTEELEDLCSDAQMELLLRLRRVKADPVANRIDDFPAYVATVTGNACNRYFRACNPNRARLRNQIRYLLLNEPLFAIQEGPHPRCGLAGWNLDQNAAPPRNIEAVGDRDLVRVITAIFEQHQRPMTIDALVECVARIWGIPVRATVGLEERGSAELVDPSGGREVVLDRHRYAIRLWREISDLPRPQRVALLLHSHDHRGYPVLQLLQLSGTAFLPQIAAVLGLTETELAELWNQLPLDDNSIAAMLSCQRQQVINFRMAARKRLANRMRGR